MNQDLKDLFSMLGFDKLEKDKQDKVKELLKKIIDKWRAGENSEAYVVMNGMMAQLKLNTLDEAASNEIKDKFMQMLSREAGYSVKEFIWNTQGAFYNPSNFNETTGTGSDISGPDSNVQGELYKRVKSTDGLHRQKPKRRDYDFEEDEVIDKLEKLKKLFLNRGQKNISLDDIKKILTEEDEEQILSAKQYLNEAAKMANVVSENKVLNYYFSESSPISSTFSQNSWSGFKYVHLSKNNEVTATNSFFVKVGNTLSKERILELQNIGIKFYFSESSLNEEFYNQDNLLDGISYEEMLTTVETNMPTEEVQPKMVQREFDRLLAMKIKDAKFNMRKAAKQIAIEVSWNNKRNIR